MIFHKNTKWIQSRRAKIQLLCIIFFCIHPIIKMCASFQMRREFLNDKSYFGEGINRTMEIGCLGVDAS